MKLLYIFPHPDDESFGPAAAIHQQLNQGHEVHLLTLTKGESTKMRYKLELSEEQMAEIRELELRKVAQLLNLTSLTILNFQDGKLAHIDPRLLENAITKVLKDIKPNILITFPIHGISGHHDHITTHFIVKELFVKLKEQEVPSLKRLAFITLPRDHGYDDETLGGNYQVNRSLGKYIDAIIPLGAEDREAFLNALECYKTFEEIIQESRVREKIGQTLYFEIFGEDHTPALQSLTEKLE